MINRRKYSLRQQFILRMFLILIATALVTGMVQLYFINQQIGSEMNNQSTLIAQSINAGIDETLLASNAIEHQIDLKLISYAMRTGDQIAGKGAAYITNEDLVSMKESMGLEGISMLARKDGDIVTVHSTDSKDIGFSLKKIGFLDAGNALLQNSKPVVPGASFLDDGIAVLPIAQSSVHTEKPTFYKYAFYHPPGAAYIISTFVQADEVYQFTKDVGPDVLISKVKKENSNVVEVGVLNPKVYADPSLEQKIYPPLKKIVHGEFKYQNEGDLELLKQLAAKPRVVSVIKKIGNKKVYQMFKPIKNGQVAYIALDYDQLSAPLYRQSILLIVSGFVSLIALFFFTIKFFSKIYQSIQRIIAQIKLLEAGNFTAQSEVSAKIGELADLSETTNRMVHTLQQVLLVTTEQASKTQRLAVLLENDANKSVDKVLTLSMETTSTVRDETEEINDFLDHVKQELQSVGSSKEAGELLQRVEAIRKINVDRSQSTTEITITLADLLKSLHAQSAELSGISKNLLQKMAQFKL